MLNSNSQKNIKRDELLAILVKVGATLLFFGLAIGIYYLFLNKPQNLNKFECFENKSNNDTIFELALNEQFGGNQRMICSIIPGLSVNNICQVNNESFAIFHFPVHIIKLLDGSYLAVFNDGRLYKKDNINNSMWLGPLDNSLPNDIVPLRMVTLANDLVSLLGVGYDNKLYIKMPDPTGKLDLTGLWKIVPNNTNIIYVFYDNDSNYLVSIDINGKLQIKTSSELDSNNMELVTKLDRSVLRMYYDMNGYMLAIDSNFNLYQFSELNWKNSELNIRRGANNTKLLDILYSNDGTLYGLSFNPNDYIVQIMKQVQPWYLGEFLSLDNIPITNTDSRFVMSDSDIIKSKSGSISQYLLSINADDSIDDDPNIAYQKQIFETRAKLKDFCNSRYSTSNANYENWDLYSNVENNSMKIDELKNVISNLIKYEPDKQRIIDKYPVISKNIE